MNLVANIHKTETYQSTIGRLQNALAPENNLKQFMAGSNYIDYKKNTSLLTICFPFFYSKKSFQYEREVVISDVAESKITINDGLKLNVDINQLIQTITFTRETGIKLESSNW
jgi:hypothetical protein